MEKIEKQIDVVLEMLMSDIAWQYQSYKSHTEEKSINSFVSRTAALNKARELVKEKLELL